MQRIPEPELMTDFDQVLGWDNANRKLSIYNLKYWVSTLRFTKGTILEIGCGAGLHIIELAKEYTDAKFVGIDGSPTMIKLAKEKIINEGLESRVSLICSKIEDYIPTQSFDAIISYGTLHHVEDQKQFWSIINKINANASPVLIIDILRPKNEELLEHYMRSADNENKFYKQDLYNSFRAAYTTTEIFDTLNDLKIPFQHYEGVHADRGNVIVILLNTNLAL